MHPGSDLDPSNPTFQKAQQACQKYLPFKGGGEPMTRTRRRVVAGGAALLLVAGRGGGGRGSVRLQLAGRERGLRQRGGDGDRRR